MDLFTLLKIVEYKCERQESIFKSYLGHEQLDSALFFVFVKEISNNICWMPLYANNC